MVDYEKICASLSDEQRAEVKASVAKSEAHNKMLREMMGKFVTAVKDEYPDAVVEFSLTAFNRTDDHEGKEFIKPRSYLAYEKVSITVNNQPTVYYLGSFYSINHFKAVIWTDTIKKLGGIV